MREGGMILSGILDTLRAQIRPGIKTYELEISTAREMEAHGVKPSFKGYHGFPACICVSVNDEVVHGIPGDRILEEGDIVSLDVGVIHKGFQTDGAITVPVGKVSAGAQRLIGVT